MPKIKLTNQDVKGLEVPESGRIDYQDETLPGLVLRVSASGRKSYSVSYWKNGKRPRVTLGDASLLSLAEARDQGREILRAVKFGLNPAEEKRRDREADTFAELANRYVERWAKVRKSPKGAREDELRIERVLIPRWGTWKAADVRKRDIVELLDEIVDGTGAYEGRGGPYASNRMQSLVSKIFSFGIERDEVEVNPATGIRRQPEKPRERVLNDGEIRTLLPLFSDEGLAGLGFRLLLLTGSRPVEVFGMRWSEIDGDVWSLPAERSKNGRPNLVPLSAAALGVLRELRAYGNRDFVFASSRAAEGFINYGRAARRIKAAAGIADWNVYDFRSTVLTGLEALGFPGAVVSAVANHAPTTITKRHYALYDYADEKGEALTAWGRHVEKLNPTTMADVVELRR